MSKAQRTLLFSTLAVLGGLAWIAAGLRPAHPTEPYDLRAWGRLPVLHEGRLKPLDSVARNTLLLFRGKQTVSTAEGERQSALAWIWEALYRPAEAATTPVFRVDHPDLVSLLGADPDQQHFFSYAELRGHLPELDRQFRRLPENGDERSPFERAVAKLHYSLRVYQSLEHSLRPGLNDLGGSFAGELERYHQLLAAQDPATAPDPALRAFQQRYRQLADRHPLKVLPVPASAEWVSLWQHLADPPESATVDPAALAYARLSDAVGRNDPAAFNAALETLETQFAAAPGVTHRVGLEAIFNGLEPFYRCLVLYLAVFLLVCYGWVRPSETLRRATLALLVLAFLLNTVGLGSRMWIMARPPVTNLYSSAVFIGWSTVLLSLVFERRFRDSMSLGVAALVGFASLIVAHNLALGGDTMEPMRAVLDSNFWLTTHVITITLGYAATFLAGFIAIVFLFRAIFTRGINAPGGRDADRMVFGVICFSLLFSFIGTVLGGIWADQSWGRFWGWDPKENGALLLVLWQAFIIHAVRCRFIHRRGLMLAAIAGNIVTSWSWFGTNMLGIGLHSYGFMDKAFVWLLAFWGSQGLLILFTLLWPRHRWRSPEALGPDQRTAGAAAPAPAPVR